MTSLLFCALDLDVCMHVASSQGNRALLLREGSRSTFPSPHEQLRPAIRTGPTYHTHSYPAVSGSAILRAKGPPVDLLCHKRKTFDSLTLPHAEADNRPPEGPKTRKANVPANHDEGGLARPFDRASALGQGKTTPKAHQYARFDRASARPRDTTVGRRRRRRMHSSHRVDAP